MGAKPAVWRRRDDEYFCTKNMEDHPRGNKLGAEKRGHGEEAQGCPDERPAETEKKRRARRVLARTAKPGGHKPGVRDGGRERSRQQTGRMEANLLGGDA